MRQPGSIQLTLPDWLNSHMQRYESTRDIERRMAFVIEASRINIEAKTGGPFAAAVFEVETGQLVSLGVNLVMSRNLSILHAEMVALALAQTKLGSYDLGAPHLKAHELVTSTEPCAMCYGAIPWSGVHRVITGSRDEDVRAIGFDEGPKVSDWRGGLESRNIEVITDVCRQNAAQVLVDYLDQGGRIYNARDEH